MQLRDWPEDERPREKLLALGPPRLSDAELLALFLGSGPRGMSAVDLGRRLLEQCGGLRALLDRAPADLARLPGLGPARASALAGALELGTRHLAQGLARGAALTEPGLAGDYLARPPAGPALRGLRLPVPGHPAPGDRLRGTVPRHPDGAEVHPREVVQRCLAHHAAAVIIGHNHPSGSAEPSAADRAVTARLKQALALVEVRLLDHFIIGDGPPCSMARLGAL